MKTYKELMTLPTFEERFNYLVMHGKVGDSTFGYDRWLNQKFYTSSEWRNVRKMIAAYMNSTATRLYPSCGRYDILSGNNQRKGRCSSTFRYW